jgi:hypothetical protein
VVVVVVGATVVVVDGEQHKTVVVVGATVEVVVPLFQWESTAQLCLVVVVVVGATVVVVVPQLVEPELLSLWFVEAFDVRAGSAMRLRVTTVTAASADRELLSN